MNTAKLLSALSVFGSLSSVAILVAAIQKNPTIFWLLVVLTFLIMHSIWIIQLARGTSWRDVNWSPARTVLIYFVISGNVGWFILRDAITG
jgi:hypothetical protein